jgi:O-antigen ligase|tara:strand:- start:1966 stop:3201 length:1236 start_codon:yes stop_codon:yes gene_type:complete
MLKNNKRLLTNLILIGISLFGIYPLIPHRLESLSVVLLAFCSIVYLIITGRKKTYTKTFFIVTFIYFVLFVSALLSVNNLEGFKKIETMLSLLVLPIVFYFLLGRVFIDFSKIRIFFLKTYYISSLVFSTVSFYLFTIYKNPKYLTADSNFYRSAILDNNFIGEHPIYVSIFISIAIIFGFSFFDTEKKIISKNLFLLFAQGYLIILLLMLMSKGVIFALIVVCLLNLIRQKRIKKIHIISSIIVLILFFILIPEKNNRFKEIINLNTYRVLNKNNSTSIRVIIYKCGIETLTERPILGYRIGDVQEKLDACYSKNNSNFVKGMYNSHNQYLFIWLSTGITGFLIFIALLIFYFKKSIQYKDNIMFSVLVLYCVIFLFENVLSRQSGVIFFSFLVNYFLWDNFNRNKIFGK